jgi:hypothetical protein
MMYVSLGKLVLLFFQGSSLGTKAEFSFCSATIHFIISKLFSNEVVIHLLEQKIHGAKVIFFVSAVCEVHFF